VQQVKHNSSSEDNFIKQLLSFIFINVLIPPYIGAKKPYPSSFMELSPDPVHAIPLSGEVLQETAAVIIAIKGDRTFRIDGLGVIRFKEGQFNAVYAPQRTLHCLYQRGQEAVTLSIAFDAPTWREFGNHFPAAHSFPGHQPAFLLESHGWITQEIRSDLHRLLHTTEATPGFSLYMSLATRILLYDLLLQSQQQRPAGPHTGDEISAIHAAREMVRHNLRRHFSIPEIAKRIGINEFKLKTGFRELFGQGIYGYLQTERLQESAQLLTESRLTIKEIADKTGYRSANSFIKAFRKTFGVTPGQYRNQQ
jgi:AraC-like DNA-binding protein